MKGLNTSKLLSHPDLYVSMNEHWIQSGFWDLMSWFLPPLCLPCVQVEKTNSDCIANNLF